MIDYSIATEENLLYCTISGEVKTIDFQHYIQNLLQDKKFHLRLDAIIRVKENLAVSYANEAAGIGQFFSQLLRQRKRIFWAFVTPNQTTKGIVSLMMQEVDSRAMSVAYFESEDEAKFWIKAN